MTRWLLVLALGCRREDVCERAVARLVRISPAQAPSSTSTIEQCREQGADRTWDPVLRCVIDSSTDAAATECIEAGVRDSVRPGPSAPPVGSV